MAPTDGSRNRALTPADAEAGFVLSSEAGWNQTVLDWRMMLAAAPVVGQTDGTGSLVATALVMPYANRIGWIAMVLTTERYRRRGLATSNLRWAIDLCAERGLIAGLDATPAGREVYLTLGFEDLWPLQRWRADVPPAPGADSRAEHDTRAINARDLPALAAMDALAFGAERQALLAYLRDNRPEQAWLSVNGGTIKGFVLGRSGRLARHIGPLVATDDDVADRLLRRALEGVVGPVSIDVPDHQPAFHRSLQQLGFAPVRPFTRMVRGETVLGDERKASFAVAGPELG